MSVLLDTLAEPRTVNSVRIRQCEKADAPTLAAMHVENLSGRFGLVLTEAYYRACLESDQHLFVCAEENGAMVGFVGMVCDRIKVVRLLLARQAFTAFACTASNPLLVGECLRHLWRWMRVRDFSRKVDLPRWEYRPVLVTEASRSKGVARLLLSAADRILDCKGVTTVFLQVAKSNAGAQKAYEKSGFKVRLEHSSTIFMIKNLAAQNPSM